MSLSLSPITLKEAGVFVAAKHRHHKPPQGGQQMNAGQDRDIIIATLSPHEQLVLGRRTKTADRLVCQIRLERCDRRKDWRKLKPKKMRRA